MSTPISCYEGRQHELPRPFAADLRAGPITLRFVDGDLREIRAGGEELVRRITFNVRHHRWDTAAWCLERVRLEQTPDAFTLRFLASCSIDAGAYTWTADICGQPDGTLTFRVAGVAHDTITEMRRAGLNVLLHTGCVAGQPFTTTNAAGANAEHRFPELIPSHHVPVNEFVTCSYRTRLQAEVSIAVSGSHFGLEDQRVAGDDSFKLFSGLRHNYAPLAKSDVQEETLTIRVRNIPTHAAPVAIRATLHPRASGTMPELSVAKFQDRYGVFHELTRRPAAKNGIFLDVNLAPEKSHDARSLTWGWYPTINLSDDETLMENASSIAGQLRTARHVAPEALIRVDPISLDSIHPRANPRDPRNDTLFGAAWLVAATKHLALGSAHEAAFAIDGPFARCALDTLMSLASRPVHDVTICSPQATLIDAFGVAADSHIVVWVVNLTAEAQSLQLEGLAPTRAFSLHRLDATFGPAWCEVPGGFSDAAGRLGIRLTPHEVRRLTFT